MTVMILSVKVKGEHPQRVQGTGPGSRALCECSVFLHSAHLEIVFVLYGDEVFCNLAYPAGSVLVAL